MTNQPLKDLGEVLAELAHAYGYRTRFDGSFTVCEDMDEQSMLAAGAKLAKHHPALAAMVADAERWRWIVEVNDIPESVSLAIFFSDKPAADVAVDTARQAAGEAP